MTASCELLEEHLRMDLALPLARSLACRLLWEPWRWGPQLIAFLKQPPP